ncbi:MAG: hypothetical protein HY927_12065 [Elusimicrobia bacterium]|nr:hypothetical protein [Elusimicrobiota bacterium]
MSRYLLAALAVLPLASCKKPAAPAAPGPAAQAAPAQEPSEKPRVSGDPVRYVNTLQQDVRKAEENKDKANAAIQQTQDAAKAVEEAEAAGK